MIPDSDSEPRPPLTLAFVFVLALLAPLSHLLWLILFEKIGVQLAASQLGMSALVTYGLMFALCAQRFRQPPARQIGLVSAPASAWIAVVFLVAAIIVSSEIDNVVKSIAPPPPAPPPDPDPSHLRPQALAAAGTLVWVLAFPLAYNLFYRGVLQPLATTQLGVIPGVLVSALLSGFGASFLPSLMAHGPWPFVPGFLNALVLCILRQSSGSLWPAIALDSLWGVAQVCASYQLFGLAGFDGAGAHTPAGWVVGCTALTVVGLVLCRAAARGGTTGSSSAARG
ncbi:MAG TPA: CPBP family intramembrane glutamic endopeptidase [Myxococcota bacterium]|nr:CPBP family intramembrane glutamic endopeptidase [Myxococcota bacterium]